MGILKSQPGALAEIRESTRKQATPTEWQATEFTLSNQLLAAESGILDAVCILTPTPDHADMVVKCLRAGFNVICEKALATSVEECQSIDNAQKETGKFLAVTFNYAGYPMIREFRNMVTSGHGRYSKYIVRCLRRLSLGRASILKRGGDVTMPFLVFR